MRSVVLDTNIWVSAIIKKQGYYAQMIQRMLSHVEIVVSEPILSEIRHTLLKDRIKKKYQLSDALIDQAVHGIRAYTTVVTHLPTLDVVSKDPDDNVVLATALAAGADFLVSYDPHLLAIQKHEGVSILTPKQFMVILEGSQ